MINGKLKIDHGLILQIHLNQNNSNTLEKEDKNNNKIHKILFILWKMINQKEKEEIYRRKVKWVNLEIKQLNFNKKVNLEIILIVVIIKIHIKILLLFMLKTKPK